MDDTKTQHARIADAIATLQTALDESDADVVSALVQGAIDALEGGIDDRLPL